MSRSFKKTKSARKRRAPQVTPECIKFIVELIHGWNGRLTWDALCEKAEPVVGARYTRQALNNYTEIKTAFSAYRGDRYPLGKSGKVSVHQQRIRSLELKVAELESVRDALLEKFVRWAVNASTRNLDAAFLDQPLRRINRSECR